MTTSNENRTTGAFGKKAGRVLACACLTTLLLAACNHKIAEGRYMFPNYRFADTMLEQLLAEKVEAMGLPDSVLMVINMRRRYNHDDTLGIGSFHTGSYYSEDINGYMSEVHGVARIAGHKCLIADYSVLNTFCKRAYWWTLLVINDSLTDNEPHQEYIEQAAYIYLDGNHNIVGDSTCDSPSPLILDNVVFTITEVDPEFPGGDDSLFAFIHNNVRNPHNVEGRVYVKCIVERNGQLSNATVIRGIDAECDQEALRVVAALPRWKPGRQHNTPVRSEYTIPIEFSKSSTN